MLKIYMAYDEEPQEGAILVFAHSASEARKVSFPVLQSWFMTEWIHANIRLVRDGEYLRSQATPEKLAADIPHCIDSPTICKDCELWGTGELNERGICPDCQHERDSELECEAEYSDLKIFY